MNDRLVGVLLSGCLVLLVPGASAGPPFQTDDPEPVELHHYEAYLFGMFDHSSGSTFSQVPAFEFNVGAAPNLQLHVMLPGADLVPGGAFGLGDVEAGIKYRFIQEKSRRPQVGVFPMLELPTGSGRRGLGNGQLWARLPVWLQKSSGSWTSYGGIGYEINHAPGMKDSVFAGWLVQRELWSRLTLGTEIYSQQAQTVSAREATFVDLGGYYNVREHLSLLFMLGRFVDGEPREIGYAGLYYTWGPTRRHT
jgi:hypothetical protein